MKNIKKEDKYDKFKQCQKGAFGKIHTFVNGQHVCIYCGYERSPPLTETPVKPTKKKRVTKEEYNRCVIDDSEDSKKPKDISDEEDNMGCEQCGAIGGMHQSNCTIGFVQPTEDELIEHQKAILDIVQKFIEDIMPILIKKKVPTATPDLIVEDEDLDECKHKSYKIRRGKNDKTQILFECLSGCGLVRKATRKELKQYYEHDQT